MACQDEQCAGVVRISEQAGEDVLEDERVSARVGQGERTPC